MPVALGALTADTVEKLAIAMVVVIALLSVVIVRSSLKFLSKVAMVVVLAGLAVALYQNRVELGRCSQTCSCEIYGHDIDVPHLPFSCNY